MKNIIISLKDYISKAIAKVTLLLKCLIGLGILMTGCPDDGSNNNDYNYNNQNPVLLPMERVSVNDAGDQANGHSYRSSMSSDGNLIAFYSEASKLVENDNNNTADVFVFERKTKTIKRASFAPDGSNANGYSSQPVISANGGFIVYQSSASNLVTEVDNNYRTDIFVYDIGNNTNNRVSVDSQGNQALLGNSTNCI